MKTVTIKEARSSLGRLIDLARRGESVIITRYGKETVHLVPIREKTQPLPSLNRFRAGIKCSGTALSSTVLNNRGAERD